MTRGRSMTFLGGAALIPLTALAVGCGSGGGRATAATPAKPAAPPPATSAPVTTIHVANSRLGKILVDSRDRTLYLFTKDSGTKSACSGMCATFWRPLRASGKAMAGSGAKASLVGTTKRSDGKPQVTYNGHRLYTFAKDKKAGNTNGEGLTAFGGRWFAISPSGKPVAPKASKSSSPAPATPKPAAPAPATPKPSAAKPAPPMASPPSNGIPQNNGGDRDSDNNGGPSDGDGNV